MSEDPWCNDDPWRRFRPGMCQPVKTKSVVAESPRHPAVVVKCGQRGTVLIHDPESASKFLDDLRSCLLQRDGDAVSISIASEHGQGWRSRAAAKKSQRSRSDANMDASAKCDDILRNSVDIPFKIGDFVEEDDIQARLSAIETSIRAQANLSRASGIICRSPSKALHRDMVAMRNVASHNFDIGVPFDSLTPSDCRRLQRSRSRSTTDPPDSPVSNIEQEDSRSTFSGSEVATTPSRSSGTHELDTNLIAGDVAHDVTYDYAEVELIENLALAASFCSSLIATGCVAMRVSFDSSGEDDDVEIIGIPSCLCTLPLAVHHNEDTVANNLKLILVEIHGQPAASEFLCNAVFRGLNSRFGLEEAMRLGGWLNNEETILSIVWNDLCESTDDEHG